MIVLPLHHSPDEPGDMPVSNATTVNLTAHVHFPIDLLRRLDVERRDLKGSVFGGGLGQLKFRTLGATSANLCRGSSPENVIWWLFDLSPGSAPPRIDRPTLTYAPDP